MKNLFIGVLIGALALPLATAAASFDLADFRMIRDGFHDLVEATQAQTRMLQRQCEATYIAHGHGDQMSRCSR